MSCKQYNKLLVTKAATNVAKSLTERKQYGNKHNCPNSASLSLQNGTELLSLSCKILAPSLILIPMCSTGSKYILILVSTSIRHVNAIDFIWTEGQLPRLDFMCFFETEIHYLATCINLYNAGSELLPLTTEQAHASLKPPAQQLTVSVKIFFKSSKRKGQPMLKAILAANHFHGKKEKIRCKRREAYLQCLTSQFIHWR